MNKNPISIGLLGFGNIGKGVVEFFAKGNGKRFGVELKKVAVLHPKKIRGTRFPHITSDSYEVINDPSIEIIIELVGGISPAKDYIIKSFKNKKSVVTANKALLAKHGRELFRQAQKNGVDLFFEASTGGGIPIIEVLNGLRGEKITKIMGILNGTTNYILTRMEEGMSFENALKIAQEKGFAEAKHILDTGGFDTRDKLTILASLAYNTNLKPEHISCEGITNITAIDIDFAAKYRVDEGKKGYAVKLLAIAERLNGELRLRVTPALLPKEHPLASVRDEFNAIYIEGELAGPQMYYGRGAGTNATTSAVISDILKAAKNIRDDVTEDLPQQAKKAKLVSPKDLESAGYIRIDLKHIPGSMYKVAGIFARNKLNINDTLQRRKFGRKFGREIFIPDIITIEPIAKRIMDKALRELGNSPRVNGKPFFLPFVE